MSKKRVEITLCMDAVELPDGTADISHYEASDIWTKEKLTEGNNLNELMESMRDAKLPITVYVHDMDFYGEFFIYWLATHGYNFTCPKPEKYLDYTCLVSSTGDIYSIEACVGMTEGKTPKKKILRFINTSKIFPIEEDDIADAFGINKELSKSQILAHAVNLFIDNGLRARTIGSDAMSMLKVLTDGYERRFPNIDELDSWLRDAYGGAFLYCKTSDRFKEYDEGGICLDVNSLYPWILDTQPLPFGYPVYFEGKYEDQNIWKEAFHYPLYIQHIRACFELKKNHLPVVQQKDKAFKTSQYIYGTGLEPMDLTLTNIELKLFLEHYDIYTIEYIDGLMFEADTGMFSDFIGYWREQKIKAAETNNKALRQISKLFLNNIGGKFATKLEFKSKRPVVDYDGSITYVDMEKRTVTGAYLPVACFMISYAKDYIIRLAQANYDRFLYSDTDSLHLSGFDIPENINVDALKFGAFKLEYRFVLAKYLHAKCYCEVTEDGEVKTAISGLPKKVQESISYDDFKSGKEIEGKLIPFNVKGGAVLRPCKYTL